MKSFVLPCLLALVVPSAATATDILQFSPRTGEQRDYQLYTHSTMSGESSYGRRSEAQEARMILRYRVLDSAKHLRLQVQPRYLALGPGDAALASAATAEDERVEDLHALMSGGFVVDLDPETGDVRGFRAGDEAVWDRIAESRSDVEALQEQLQEQMMRQGAPGVAAGIPLREGAELTIPGSGDMHDLQLRVVDVAADEIRLELDAGDADSRMAGFMVFERGSGWLRRMGVVIEDTLAAGGMQGTVRHRVTMVPDDWRGALPLVDSLVIDDPEFRPTATAPDEWEALAEPPRREEVFASPVGEFDFGAEGIPSRMESEQYAIGLRLGHRMRDRLEFGRVELSALELLDADGNRVDVPVHVGRAWTYRSWNHAHASSRVLLLPLGWGVEQDLEKVAEIRAVARYTPLVHNDVEVALDPERSVRTEAGDAWVTATPLGREGMFEFRFGGNQDEAYMAWTFAPELGARVRLQPDSGVETVDWLEPVDVEFLARVRNDGGGRVLQVQLEEVPERLRFHAFASAAEPAWEQPVRFLPPARRHADIDLPPMAQLWLYPEEMREEAGHGDRDRPSTAVADLQPTGADHHRLGLELDHAQAALCTLSVENDARLQGEPLQWQLDPKGSGSGWQSAHQLPATQRWQLRTRDGVRNHFYDLEVVTRLYCEGDGRWRTVAHDGGERPWLVDLRALLGRAPDSDMPLRELLGRYRFLDEDGDALAPAAPAFDAPPVAEAVLGDYLFDDRYLRVAGIPVKVEALEAVGRPLERRWTTRFAPLP